MAEASKSKKTKAKPTQREQWLLAKMGKHESAWAYRDTLARVSGLSEKNATRVLDSLLRKGLIEVDESSSFGPRYRMTSAGAEKSEPDRERQEKSPGAA